MYEALRSTLHMPEAQQRCWTEAEMIQLNTQETRVLCCWTMKPSPSPLAGLSSLRAGAEAWTSASHNPQRLGCITADTQSTTGGLNSVNKKHEGRKEVVGGTVRRGKMQALRL